MKIEAIKKTQTEEILDRRTFDDNYPPFPDVFYQYGKSIPDEGL